MHIQVYGLINLYILQYKEMNNLIVYPAISSLLKGRLKHCSLAPSMHAEKYTYKTYHLQMFPKQPDPLEHWKV